MSCSTDSRAAPPPLRVTRGATKTLLFTVRADPITGDLAATASSDPPATGSLVDLTGAKVWFTAKDRIEDVGAAIAKRNAAAGGVDNQILVVVPQTGISLGQFRLLIDPADTAALESALLWCDAWVQLPGGPPLRRYQVAANRQLVVESAVTNIF